MIFEFSSLNIITIIIAIWKKTQCIFNRVNSYMYVFYTTLLVFMESIQTRSITMVIGSSYIEVNYRVYSL